MDEVGMQRLLRAQDGVVARRQLVALDARGHDLERMLRRKELAVVHPGVYVDHTGPPSPRQLAWAAVLFAAPAALCLGSALDPERQPVHVAIDSARRVRAPQGVVVHRVVGLADRTRWNMSPPRIRVEEAVLEHGYLTRVERAHGLPRAARQRVRRTQAGVEYRDVEYDGFGLVVELDGRAGHDSWAASGRDADRDLDDRAEGRETVRLRHQQVFGTPCRTARRIAAILRRRGWAGSPRSCGRGCAVAA